MLGLIYRLIIGVLTTCKHEWRCEHELNVEYALAGKNKIYVMRCTRCGEMKNHRITD